MNNKLKILILIVLITILSFVIYKNFSDKIQFKKVKKTEKFDLYNENAKIKKVKLFAGDLETDGFKVMEENIFESEYLINEIKQVIQKLLELPKSKEYIKLIPEGTILKEAYLDSNNICYLDFSLEIKVNHKGGTRGEYLTIYSIVNTVFNNFPQIKGVRLLIDGKEEDTLAGHIDISEILLPSVR